MVECFIEKWTLVVVAPVIGDAGLLWTDSRTITPRRVVSGELATRGLSQALQKGHQVALLIGGQGFGRADINGVFDIDLSLTAIESSFGRSFVRVHRNWLINVTHVKELTRDGETRVWVGDGLAAHGRGIHVPVARERAQQVLDLLLADTTGLRRGTNPHD